jgi:molybdate transport system ATP-binding protein
MSFDIAITRRIGDRTIAAQVRSDAGVVALVGPSGVGKSSILNMVAGLLKPDSGHIKIAGETLFDAGIDIPAHRRRAGYVFQDRRLFPHLKVRANLLYGRPKHATASLDDIVAFLGIAPLLNRWPTSLSGGEAQRVAIGRALLSEPRFLLLDEPLSSLDPDRKAGILQAIRDIRARLALPILHVTHDIAEAQALDADIVTLTPS